MPERTILRRTIGLIIKEWSDPFESFQRPIIKCNIFEDVRMEGCINNRHHVTYNQCIESDNGTRVVAIELSCDNCEYKHLGARVVIGPEKRH